MCNGLLLVDKPKNLTSNQTLKILKKRLNIKKAGIVGILDPLAHGMLPILFGEATKFSSYIESYKKKYEVVCQLGSVSTTGDKEGIVTPYKQNNLKLLEQGFINTRLKKFFGELLQTPPMFSGLKVKGEKLYNLARKGITIPRKPRKIFIHDIKLMRFQGSVLKLSIVCSKGTYIRTLVEEIGKDLSVGAYIKDLQRVEIGKYKKDIMIKLDQIKNLSITKTNYFVDINTILSDEDSFILSDLEEKKIRMGQPVHKSSEFHNKLVTIYNKNNIIGIAVIKNNCIYPKRLINFSE
ncbi:MAG: tRNA pseudouridine(55) synthase TruB [Pseudomonadota bacterium]|nr:tRNA pseudouridine(55) synthase TruB [Pseudomonadota bacterium]